jgi:hypothetical protein
MIDPIKAFSAIVAVLLVVSLTLTALGVISWRLFWVIAILAAIIAYYAIPKLRGEQTGFGE